MRNIIVTGASRGLGLAIASTLAAGGRPRDRRGAQSDRGTHRGDRGMRAPAAGRSSSAPFDLTDTPAIAGFVSGVRKEFGPLYGLVNNAGLGTAGVLAIMREADIEQLTRLNVIAPLVLTQVRGACHDA